MRHSDRTPVSY